MEGKIALIPMMDFKTSVIDSTSYSYHKMSTVQ